MSAKPAARINEAQLDWGKIMAERSRRAAPPPEGISEEEEERYLAEREAWFDRPGRFVPFDGGQQANGLPWKKERWIYDDELPTEHRYVGNEEPKNETQSVADLGNGRLPSIPGVGDIRPSDGGPSAQASLAEPVSDVERTRLETDGNLALKRQAEVVNFPKLKIVPASVAPYDKKLWKLSREKPGCLIQRISGYDITEDKYGISYLFCLPGGSTTTSQGEHSGYYNWLALEAAGRLQKVGEK